MLLSLLELMMSEVARCFGEGANGKTISNQVSRSVKPIAKLRLLAISVGKDPAEVDLSVRDTNYAGSIAISSSTQAPRHF